MRLLITKLGLLLGLAVGIVSCTSDRQVLLLSLGQACDAYAGALRVLTPQRAAGLLSQGQVETIDQLNTVTDAACSDPPPEDVAGALSQVTMAVNKALLMARTEKQ